MSQVIVMRSHNNFAFCVHVHMLYRNTKARVVASIGAAFFNRYPYFTLLLSLKIRKTTTKVNVITYRVPSSNLPSFSSMAIRGLDVKPLSIEPTYAA